MSKLPKKIEISKTEIYTLLPQQEPSELESSFGGVYENQKGEKFYFKIPWNDNPEQNEISVHSEVLYAEIMQAIFKNDPGIVIPEYSLRKIAIDGKERYASVYKVVEVKKFSTEEKQKIVSAEDKLQSYCDLLVAHAILCNLDGIKLDNYELTKDNKILSRHFEGGFNLSSKLGQFYKDPGEFSYEVTAINKMLNEQQNILGEKFEFNPEQIKASVQKVVGLLYADTNIVNIIEKHGYGLPELKENIIRRMYNAALQYDVVPKKLTKYSSRNDLLNYIANTYLYFKSSNDTRKEMEKVYQEQQREYRPKFKNGMQVYHPLEMIIHGQDHGIRTALLIRPFNDLYGKYDPEGIKPIKNPDLLKMLEIAAGLHDVGRTSDYGLDTVESETSSGDVIYDVLTKLGFDPRRAQMLRLVAIYKDHAQELVVALEKSSLQDLVDEAKACQRILQLADQTEVVRCRGYFDYRRTNFYEFVENIMPQYIKNSTLKNPYVYNKTHAHKDFMEILIGNKTVQIEMGDAQRNAVNLEFKIPLGDKEKDIKVSGANLNLDKKEKFNNSLQPFDDIRETFRNIIVEVENVGAVDQDKKIKKTKIKVFEKYDDDVFLAIPVFHFATENNKKEQEEKLNSSYLISYTKDKQVTTNKIKIPIDLFSKGEVAPYNYMLDEQAFKQQSEKIKQLNITRINKEIKILNLDVQPVKNIDDSLVPNIIKQINVVRINRKIEELKKIEKLNSEIKLIDNIEEISDFEIDMIIDRINQLCEALNHLKLQKFALTTLERPFILNKEQFEIVNESMAFFKGSEFSPNIIMEKFDGFLPIGVLPDQNLAYDALDVTKFRDRRQRNDSSYISVSMDANVSKYYATKYNNKNGVGCVYLILPRASRSPIKAKVDGEKAEVNFPGGCSAKDIIAYRKAKIVNSTSVYDDNYIYVREAAIRQYGKDKILELLHLYLEPGETMYYNVPRATTQKEQLDALNSFFEVVEKSLLFNDIDIINDDALNKAFILIRHLDAQIFINKFNDIEQDKRDNVLRINILLAIKNSCDDYFWTLMKQNLLIKDRYLFVKYLTKYFESQPNIKTLVKIKERLQSIVIPEEVLPLWTTVLRTQHSALLSCKDNQPCVMASGKDLVEFIKLYSEEPLTVKQFDKIFQEWKKDGLVLLGEDISVQIYIVKDSFLKIQVKDATIYVNLSKSRSDLTLDLKKQLNQRFSQYQVDFLYEVIIKNINKTTTEPMEIILKNGLIKRGKDLIDILECCHPDERIAFLNYLETKGLVLFGDHGVMPPYDELSGYYLTKLLGCFKPDQTLSLLREWLKQKNLLFSGKTGLLQDAYGNTQEWFFTQLFIRSEKNQDQALGFIIQEIPNAIGQYGFIKTPINMSSLLMAVNGVISTKLLMQLFDQCQEAEIKIFGKSGGIKSIGLLLHTLKLILPAERIKFLDYLFDKYKLSVFGGGQKDNIIENFKDLKEFLLLLCAPKEENQSALLFTPEELLTLLKKFEDQGLQLYGKDGLIKNDEQIMELVNLVSKQNGGHQNFELQLKAYMSDDSFWSFIKQNFFVKKNQLQSQELLAEELIRYFKRQPKLATLAEIREELKLMMKEEELQDLFNNILKNHDITLLSKNTYEGVIQSGADMVELVKIYYGSDQFSVKQFSELLERLEKNGLVFYKEIPPIKINVDILGGSDGRLEFSIGGKCSCLLFCDKESLSEALQIKLSKYLTQQQRTNLTNFILTEQSLSITIKNSVVVDEDDVINILKNCQANERIQFLNYLGKKTNGKIFSGPIHLNEILKLIAEEKRIEVLVYLLENYKLPLFESDRSDHIIITTFEDLKELLILCAPQAKGRRSSLFIAKELLALLDKFEKYGLKLYAQKGGIIKDNDAVNELTALVCEKKQYGFDNRKYFKEQLRKKSLLASNQKINEKAEEENSFGSIKLNK
jgi:hypothetical protein